MPTANTVEFPRTIKRNAREVRDFVANAVKVESFTLGNCFVGEEVSLDWFKANILGKIEESKPRIRQDKPKCYVIHYHSNHWLEVTVA